MSDYLQRLVRRAIPTKNYGQAKPPEVRPAAPIFRNLTADLQSDLDIEAEVPDPAMDARQPVPAHLQASELRSAAAVNRARNSPIPAPSSASQINALQPRTGPPRLFLDNPGSDHLGVLQLTTKSTTFIKENGNHSKDKPSESRVEPLTAEQHREEISPLSETGFLSPDDRSENVLIHQSESAGPELQPASQPVGTEPGQAGEITGAPRLEPLITTIPEATSSRSEPGRLVIDSMTVEVLPATPQSQTEQPAVQVTQIVQPAPQRHNRPSKLRFGLRQM